MESLKRRWKAVPGTIRKPVVLVLGSICIIAAGLTGWLPGPGGIPLFLLGIAILATEFERAQKLRDWTLHKLHTLGVWWRGHRVIGTIVFVLAGLAFLALAFGAYTGFTNLRQA